MPLLAVLAHPPNGHSHESHNLAHILSEKATPFTDALQYFSILRFILAAAAASASVAAATYAVYTAVVDAATVATAATTASNVLLLREDCVLLHLGTSTHPTAARLHRFPIFVFFASKIRDKKIKFSVMWVPMLALGICTILRSNMGTGKVWRSTQPGEDAVWIIV